MVTKSNCSIDQKQVIFDHMDEIGAPPPPFDDPIRHITTAGSWVTTGSSLAGSSPLFAPVFDLQNEKAKLQNALMADHEDLLFDLSQMPNDQRIRMNSVLEYLRLSKTSVRDTGRNFSIKTREIRDGDRRIAPELSKPGQVLTLNAEDTKTLLRIRDYLDSRYTLHAQSVMHSLGYKGPYDRMALEQMDDSDPMKANFIELFTALEQQRVTSYIPFMRSGDVNIIVRGPDGSVDTGGFYMLDTRKWLKDMVGKRFQNQIKEPQIEAKIAELRKKYPASQGYTMQIVRTGALDNVNSKRLSIDDVGSLDKVLSLMDARSGAIIKQYFDKTMGGLLDGKDLDHYTVEQVKQISNGFISELPIQIRASLIKDIMAGFTKESRNIAGYNTDLIGSIFDYNRIVAATVAHRTYREPQRKAYDKLMRKASDPEKKYAERWSEYIDSPEWGLWRAARTVGFFNSMWGSLSSTMVNAAAVWAVVAPQMTIMKASAYADVYKSSLQAMAGMRGRVGQGLIIDPYKVPGLTEDQRAALIWAYKRGTVRAQVAPEIMGVEAGLLAMHDHPVKKTARSYFNYGASVISVTEEMQKIAAFMTAYKYANDPVALNNWAEAYGTNERAKGIIARGMNPREVAEFMVETTTFIGGQIEKPPILRNAGGVAFQFSQYPLQLGRAIKNNLIHQGTRGKVAGMSSLMSVMMLSGVLFGIPFGDDAINIFEWLYNQFNEGAKMDFRDEASQVLVDYFGGDDDARIKAEAVLYGPTRSMFGVNAGQRVGFSSMLPELGNPISSIPALSSTVNTVANVNGYFKRKMEGDDIVGYTMLLQPVMGKGISDLAKAFIIMPHEGYRTGKGNLVKPADELSPTDKIARAMGFQSADIARRAQLNQVVRGIETSTQEAERNMTSKFARYLAGAIKAEESGDMATANRLRASFEKEMTEAASKMEVLANAGKLNEIVKIPTESTLRSAIIEELHPELRLTKGGRLKLQALIEAQERLLIDDTDNLLMDQEDDMETPEGMFPQ